MMILFGVVQLMAAEFIPAQRSRGEVLVFRRRFSRQTRKRNDEEQNSHSDVHLTSINGDAAEPEKTGAIKLGRSIGVHPPVFHWKNVNYSIKMPSGTREILKNMEGWMKPGTLTALMVRISFLYTKTYIRTWANRFSREQLEQERLRCLTS
jgi:ATP-binding cassette, subfamily G (WHITE), member 2, PDR